MANNQSRPSSAQINLCPLPVHNIANDMLNLLRMCLLNMLNMLVVLLLQFDKDYFPFHFHQQNQSHNFRYLSRGRCYPVRFELHHFLNCHSAIPPPVISLTDIFERRTAPPAMEQPINKKENKHIKNLFIFFIPLIFFFPSQHTYFI